MLQPIRLITESGIELDIPKDTTIELTMGGISLLTLEGRTATYTTAFKLPRTPKNEKILLYASQLTSSSRPSVNITAIIGSIQTLAIIVVLDYQKDTYSCSISFNNNVTNILKNSIDFDVNPNPLYA